jgi:hypothetical protein
MDVVTVIVKIDDGTCKEGQEKHKIAVKFHK